MRYGDMSDRAQQLWAPRMPPPPPPRQKKDQDWDDAEGSHEYREQRKQERDGR